MAAKAEALQREFAPAATPEERELHGRFERRLANLQALRASADLTLAQIPVAIAHFQSLLDRFVDVKMALFPVWERHALAVVQTPKDSEALAALRTAATALVETIAGVIELQAKGRPARQAAEIEMQRQSTELSAALSAKPALAA